MSSLIFSLREETRGLKEIAYIAMEDWENNHITGNNKQSKYGKVYFIENSSQYLSSWTLYKSFMFTAIAQYER